MKEEEDQHLKSDPYQWMRFLVFPLLFLSKGQCHHRTKQQTGVLKHGEETRAENIEEILESRELKKGIPLFCHKPQDHL